MIYLEFVRRICKHPKGWRLGVLNKEIYIEASSATKEETRIVRDLTHLLYETFSNDPGAPARMLSNRSDLVTAAVQVWLEQ